jgi:tetratricopeptide (TPR) repeat protein
MTVEEKSSGVRRKAILLSPWLVVAGALLLYGMTVNHWVTLRSLPLVAQVTGWDWHPLPMLWRPANMAPLFFVLTYPVRLFPVSLQPLCLNLFTAVCGALTLGLLAASVRLMPHDRTREQRLREGGEHALLSIRAALLPPLFAVLMLGLQRTFWLHAISATGEMLDLLVFAFLVFCALRFRISQNDKWLFALAFVYGLGLSDNWALLAYYPLFVIALIWIKGVAFFNPRFFGLMAVCGLAGLSLYLLIPAIGAIGPEHADFKMLLHQEFGMQSYSLRLVPRYIVLVGAFATILPLIFASVRWPSFEGEVSAAGGKLTHIMFQALHAVFLLFALAIFFDFQYSPSVRMNEMPNTFLTFYYVAALCIGYFAGYFLLVFGRRPQQLRIRVGSAMKFFNRTIVVAVWILALGAPIALAIQNYPHLKAATSPVLSQFSDAVVDTLPRENAIVLSDDPGRLELLQAAYDRRHLPNKNVLIDTSSLAHREYLIYIEERYPQFKQRMTPPEKLPPVISEKALEKFMYQVGHNHPIYYLHNSFGYYFEEFYLKPKGPVYELKGYPNTSARPPLPTAEEIATNQAFWTQFENGPMKSLASMAKLDLDPEVVSADYSVDLDFWGTELQKANRLKDAHAWYADAIELNPDNYIARINLQYNEALQKGNPRPIDSSEAFYKALTKYNGLTQVLRLNGPVDEPDLDLNIGEVMAEGGNLRQAAALFLRRLELLPNDSKAELAMAKTYADLGKVDKAVELIDKLRSNSKVNQWDLVRVQAIAYLAATNNEAAESLLKNAIKQDPSDEVRFATLADFYRRVGFEALQHSNTNLAKADFVAALSALDQELKLLDASHASGETLFPLMLLKAQLQMTVGSNTAAISTLNTILQMQPQNTSALLYRATVEVRLKQMAAAKDDYKALRDLLPQDPYTADLHLAEVASLEKDTPEEIRCLKRYLKAAPPETAEYANVLKILQNLESH